jgi:hypothetical protein
LERELQEATTDPSQTCLSLEWCLQAALEISDAWLESPGEAAKIRGLLDRAERQAVDLSSVRSLVHSLRERLGNASIPDEQ